MNGRARLTHLNFINTAALARCSGVATRRPAVFNGFWRVDPKPLKRLNTLPLGFLTGLKPDVDGRAEKRMTLDTVTGVRFLFPQPSAPAGF